MHVALQGHNYSSDFNIINTKYTNKYNIYIHTQKIYIGAQPDEFEKRVSKALFDLEMSGSMKSDLSRLYIVAAKEVEVPGGKPAIVCFVPFKLLRAFHTVQAQLIREMEKKFNGQHVLIIAQRQIYGMSYKRRTSKGSKGPRPRSRTLTNVQEAILDDLVYPTEIVGKRTRFATDGSKTMKVLLDPKDQVNVETKLDTFATVYKTLTQKDVVFEFPVQES